MRRRRGSVFILTLAVLVALVGLIATLAATNREFSRAQANRLEERRAWLMVDAGFQKAISVLQKVDLSKATLTDDWATLGDRGNERFLVGRDSFRIQILDAGARVNANVAEEPQLKKLSLSDEQVDSLLDWREDKQTPRPQGAKDEFYGLLPHPYATRLKPLESVDELLQIKGFTLTETTALRDVLTVDSASADRNVAGSKKMDINSADRDRLMEIGVPQGLADAILQAKGGGFRKMQDVLQVQNMTPDAARTLADNTQIGDDAQRAGLINLNTATQATLATVPDLTEEQAKAILDHQRSGFGSIGEMLSLPGMALVAFARLVDRFCVGSRAFIVRVIGTAATRKEAAEAILTLDDNGEATIKRIQPVPYPFARDGWNWPEEAQRTTDIESSSYRSSLPSPWRPA